MIDVVGHARMLFAYDRWANSKILEAAALLTPEQLEEDARASFGSVRGNMAHMLGANGTWYRRITGEALAPSDASSLEGLRAGFEAAYAGWDAFAQGMSPDDWGRVVAYRSTQGVAHERALGHLVTHLVNHGTFHRGETGMMLARYGHSPGDLDLVYFVDEWSA